MGRHASGRHSDHGSVFDAYLRTVLFRKGTIEPQQFETIP